MLHITYQRRGCGLPVALVVRIRLHCTTRKDTGWIPGREDPLEEEMATLSSVLAWRIPGTEEPGGLQSTGSRRVRRD